VVRVMGLHNRSDEAFAAASFYYGERKVHSIMLCLIVAMMITISLSQSLGSCVGML